jgi:hypothetical protein
MLDLTRAELTELLSLCQSVQAATPTSPAFDRALEMRVMILNGIEIKVRAALGQ